MNSLKLITIIILLLISLKSIACGPRVANIMFFPIPSYISNDSYEVNIPPYDNYSKEFVRAHIPVLSPNNNINSFLIAYRYLESKPNIVLDEPEVTENPPLDYFYKWQELNAKIYGEELKIVKQFKEFQIEKDGINTNYAIENCTNDAFKFAVEQFELKEKKYNKETFRTWLDNQNLVYQNCNSEELILPQNQTLNNIDLNKDYDYQVAASYFYNANYDKAIEEFEKISVDTQSPYQDLAQYLVYRSLFRKIEYQTKDGGNLFIDKFNANKSVVEKSKYAEDINALNDYFITNAEPKKKIHQLLDNLIDKNFDQKDLAELKYLQNIYYYEYTKINSEYSIDHPFTNWMNLWRNDNTTFKQVDNLWKQYKTLPWLMLACEKVKKEDIAFKDELIKALKQIKIEQPGYTMAQQYLAKFALIADDYIALKQITEDILGSQNLVLHGQNLFKYLHSFTTENYKKFLDDIVTTKVSDDSYNAELENSVNIRDFDDVNFNNIQQVPIELLIEASDYDLPLYLRQRFIAAGFARHIVLGNVDKIDKLIPKLIQLIPELEKDFNILKETKDEDKTLFAHLIMMRYPSFNIYVNNYQWRRYMEDKSYAAGIEDLRANWFGYRSYYDKVPFHTNFLNELQKQQANTELEKIDQNLDKNTVNYFCNKAIDAYNMKSHLAPEMLHKCVYMSRYHNDEVPLSSKKAFEILHKNFKDNIFTEKTPHHYYRDPGSSKE